VQFKKLEYDLVWNRDYSLVGGLFSVNTLQGRIKVPFDTKGMEKYFNHDWSFETAKLVNKYGKFFLHIPMSKEIPQLKDTEVKQIVGIDLGVNFITASYDSQEKTTFFDGREAKHIRSRYQQLRRHLQRLKTPSARRKLKKIGQRENRWMTNVNHKVSKALVERYGAHTLFVIEDLTGVRNAMEKVRLNNRYETVSWAFYQLRQMLEYKATLTQSKVIAVNPQYTSQTCPKCGHAQKANRNKQKHLFFCKNCCYTANVTVLVL